MYQENMLRNTLEKKQINYFAINYIGGGVTKYPTLVKIWGNKKSHFQDAIIFILV